MSQSPIRALIVEDEPLARTTLRQFLALESQWQLVGEACNGVEALSLIESTAPDVIFLDIHMPLLNGLELAKKCHEQCVIVFTTAYEQHAVTAFELGVSDYLLKPFGRARFQACLARVQKHFLGRQMEQAAEEPEYLERFLVRDRGRQQLVISSDIMYLRADDDYVEIQTTTKCLLITGSLSKLTETLHPANFQRVSRSLVVNLQHIESLSPHERQLLIRFKDGTEVISSRRGASALRSALSMRI